MADDVAEKSQPATNRKREQARRDGVVARSPDLTAAAAMLAALAMLAICGGKIVSSLQTMLASALSGTSAPLRQSSLHTIRDVGKSLAPVVAAIVIACIVAQLVQVGFNFDAGRLSPKFRKARGKASAANRLTNGLINLLKFILIALFTWVLIRPRLEQIAILQKLPPSEIPAAAWSLIYAVGIRLAAFVLMLGTLDYIYRRVRLEKQLMMTPAELKQELRLTEGDPRIKRRRRELAMRKPVMQR